MNTSSPPSISEANRLDGRDIFPSLSCENLVVLLSDLSGFFESKDGTFGGVQHQTEQESK